MFVVRKGKKDNFLVRYRRGEVDSGVVLTSVVLEGSPDGRRARCSAIRCTSLEGTASTAPQRGDRPILSSPQVVLRELGLTERRRR